MTKEKTESEKRRKLMEEYVYGGLAGRLLTSESEGDRKLTNNALEKIAEGLGDRAKGFVQGAMATQEGIQTATSVYANLYQEARGKLTVGELYDNYRALRVLKDEDSERVEGVLKDFKDDTLGSILKKYRQAAAKIKDRKEGIGNFKDEDYEAAEKTLKKYGAVVGILETLEDYKMETLRGSIVKDYARSEIKKYLPEEKKEEKGKKK